MHKYPFLTEIRQKYNFTLSVFFKKSSLGKSEIMESEKVRSWVYKCLSEKKADFSRNLGSEDIEDFTNDFLLDLRAIFESFAKAFNSLKARPDSSEEGSEEVKEKLKNSLFVYGLTEGRGFMLFRKGYRLIFSYVQPGRIRVQFLKQKPFAETENFEDAFIDAITSGTLSINWVHENHKGFVDIQILARYYMKRFLQEI